MEQLTTYIGLDVHKDTIAVALAEEGKRGEVREHGRIANTPAALAKLAGKLAGAGRALTFCYEAATCLVAEHCWDPVSLAISDDAYRFERLPRAVRRRR